MLFLLTEASAVISICYCMLWELNFIYTQSQTLPLFNQDGRRFILN